MKIISSFLGHRMITFNRWDLSEDIIGSQLTNISSQHQRLNDVLNLYKNDIISFNGKLLNKQECQLKGAQYNIQINFIDCTGRFRDLIWELRYLKLVDIDTIESFEQILHQLRSSNSKYGFDSFISCFYPNEEEPGQIFKDGCTKYSCFEKFNNLDKGFQLAIFVPHKEKEYCDVSVVEDIIMSFLELGRQLKEEDFKLVEGEIVENKLKLSAVLAKDADFTRSIMNQSLLKESNWSSTINYKHPNDLYLTSSRVNFKIFDKQPPSYNEATSL